MKLLILILLLCIIAPASANLTLQPEVFDTYFLYSGMGENQTSKYEFHSNYDVINCEMIPQDNNTRCIIKDDYMIEVWFSTIGEAYFGQLQVTNYNGTVANSTIIIRTHDFGSYTKIVNIPVGSVADSDKLNLFFSTEDENIIGIRNWLIWWIFILLGFTIFKLKR